jgi:hypothetical protein
LALQEGFGIFAFQTDQGKTIQNCQRIARADRRNLPEQIRKLQQAILADIPVILIHPNLPRLVHLATPVISTPN